MSSLQVMLFGIVGAASVGLWFLSWRLTKRRMERQHRESIQKLEVSWKTWLLGLELEEFYGGIEKILHADLFSEDDREDATVRWLLATAEELAKDSKTDAGRSLEFASAAVRIVSRTGLWSSFTCASPEQFALVEPVLKHQIHKLAYHGGGSPAFADLAARMIGGVGGIKEDRACRVFKVPDAVPAKKKYPERGQTEVDN